MPRSEKVKIEIVEEEDVIPQEELDKHRFLVFNYEEMESKKKKKK